MPVSPESQAKIDRLSEKHFIAVLTFGEERAEKKYPIDCDTFNAMTTALKGEINFQSISFSNCTFNEPSALSDRRIEESFSLFVDAVNGALKRTPERFGELNFRGTSITPNMATKLWELAEEQKQIVRLTVDNPSWQKQLNTQTAKNQTQRGIDNINAGQSFIYFNGIPNMPDSYVVQVAEALRGNTTVKELDFGFCNLTEEGGKILRQMMAENNTITTLNMYSNDNITLEDRSYIARKCLSNKAAKDAQASASSSAASSPSPARPTLVKEAALTPEQRIAQLEKALAAANARVKELESGAPARWSSFTAMVGLGAARGGAGK